MQSMKADCASLISIVGLPPAGNKDAWTQTLWELFDESCRAAEFSKSRIEKYEALLETYIRIIKKIPVIPMALPSVPSLPPTYDAIKAMNQVEQRTPEWYELRRGALSATQVPNLFASPRQYGLMVLEKAGVLEKPKRENREAIQSEFMNPFDWGIRFEPVLRACMEKLWSTKIEEVGCIAHGEKDLRLVASPDGLMSSGVLVEFKCPITREIGGKVPDDYWKQMQIQMEVTGAEECEYVEAIFRSAAPKRYELLQGPAMDISGTLYVCQKSEDDSALFYNYGAANADGIIVETVQWELMGYQKVTVKRDRLWFDGEVRPRIKKFWEDVQLARNGNFTVPDAKKRKRKEDECLIHMAETEPQADISLAQPLGTEQSTNQDTHA